MESDIENNKDENEIESEVEDVEREYEEWKKKREELKSRMRYVERELNVEEVFFEDIGDPLRGYELYKRKEEGGEEVEFSEQHYILAVHKGSHLVKRGFYVNKEYNDREENEIFVIRNRNMVENCVSRREYDIYYRYGKLVNRDKFRKQIEAIYYSKKIRVKKRKEKMENVEKKLKKSYDMYMEKIEDKEHNDLYEKIEDEEDE